MSRTSGARFPDPPDGSGNPPQLWLVRVPVVTTFTYIVEAEDRKSAETAAVEAWGENKTAALVEPAYVDRDIIESEEL